jgi:hypothetical protein
MVTFLERLGCEVEKAAAEVVVREVERPPRLGDELGDPAGDVLGPLAAVVRGSYIDHGCPKPPCHLMRAIADARDKTRFRVGGAKRVHTPPSPFRARGRPRPRASASPPSTSRWIHPAVVGEGATPAAREVNAPRGPFDDSLYRPMKRGRLLQAAPLRVRQRKPVQRAVSSSTSRRSLRSIVRSGFVADQSAATGPASKTPKTRGLLGADGVRDRSVSASAVSHRGGVEAAGRSCPSRAVEAE